MLMNRYLFVVISCLIGIFSCQRSDSESEGDTLFSLLASTDTGVDFVNEVEDQNNFIFSKTIDD